MGTPGSARPRLVAGLRLVRTIGRGGEGEVWEARDAAGRPRALKLVRPSALAAPAAIAQRGRWLERIDHPALVRVHATGVVGDGPLAGWGWVEMDLVEGRSLAGAAADPDVLERLAPLAEALDLLHAGAWSDGVPLVHRDVKPANLLVRHDGTVVLVDPSTLRGVDAAELTRVGTPLFAAPEVVTGRIGPPADVYSFAATVVALLTGARGDALAALLDDPSRLDLPGGVTAALSPVPAERPAACAEVLEPVLTETIPSRWEPPLLDPEGEWLEHEPAAVPTRTWTWLLLLALTTVVPAAAWASSRVDEAMLVGVVLVAGMLHVVAGTAARVSPGLVFLAPPVAWAFLLAERRPGTPRRRAWTRAALSGSCTLLAGALGLPLLQPGVAPHIVVAATAGAWALTALAVRVAAVGGWPGLLLRLVHLPVWALGAVLLLAAALPLLPFAAMVGAARPVARLLGHTLASPLEFLRGPRAVS